LSGSPSSQQTISTEGKNQSATAPFMDVAGNTATSTVDGINIDMTGPVVSFTRTAPNANGWNKTAVVVSFNATDAFSGIDGASSADRTISTEGKNQSASATFTDLAGNTATGTADGINIDMTPPTLQFGTPSPLPNAAGWNNADVRIGFTTADNLSGVASTSVPSPLVLTGEGLNLKGTVVVTDAAGNVANFVSSSANIDRTSPVASAVASPPASNGNVTVTFSGADSLSGIASCSAPVVLSNSGANQSASGTCTDKAGNVSQPATVTGININKVAASISGLPAPGCSIWPPDRRMVQIAAVTATGVTPGSLTVTVTSNETVTSSDVVVNNGVVQVRADRDGKGNGRIYTVNARATDPAGNPVVASGSCSVPHDQDRQ
jgi:hypothetical protein